MNTQSTVEQLQQLKLYGMSKRYQAVLDQPDHQQPEVHTLIGMLADAETQYRLSQRTQLYLRLSRLRYHALPEQVHATAERGLSKEQLLILCDGMFIEKGENVLITGATGSGKSYLACALGRQACMLGYRTVYFAMNRFIEALAAARLDGSYIKWLNHIARMPLLIIDDFGLQPLDHNMKLTLLQILEDRYGKGSTIITSQLPIKAWYEYIQEPTIADAIMDRLTAYAHKIELKGESLRKKKTTNLQTYTPCTGWLTFHGITGSLCRRITGSLCVESPIKGIGKQTAINLYVYTKAFTEFENAKQLACYCGVVPFTKTSGTSVRYKTGVSPYANRKLKKLLHLCAMAAIRWNEDMKRYYERKVGEGKNKMSVINAVRNKLIHRIFAVVRDQRMYVEKLCVAGE